MTAALFADTLRERLHHQALDCCTTKFCEAIARTFYGPPKIGGLGRVDLWRNFSIFLWRRVNSDVRSISELARGMAPVDPPLSEDDAVGVRAMSDWRLTSSRCGIDLTLGFPGLRSAAP